MTTTDLNNNLLDDGQEEALRKARLQYPIFFTSIDNLKEEQTKVIKSILERQHTFVNLSTGYGKSLMYILPPLLADQIDPDVQHVSVIVCPLLSIMNEQVARLKACGIKAHGICSKASSSTKESVKEGNCQIVFFTPESLAELKWRQVLQHLVGRVSVYVIDECHVVKTWGDTFREKYRSVGEVSSFIRCPILFLSGTATTEVKADLLKLFDLDDIFTVARIPDRENIRLYVEHTTHSHKHLDWLLEHYKCKGINGKKTLIFATTIPEATELYFYLLDKLDKSGVAYIGGEKTVNARIIDMYHSHSSTHSDERIQHVFSRDDSTIRVLVSTIRLGMGVDIPDVDIVVLFGCPDTIIDAWQELGRAARGPGRTGLGVVYLTGESMRGIKDKTLLKLREEEECVRKVILLSFTLNPLQTEDAQMKTSCPGNCTDMCSCSKCLCCNICAKSCSCSQLFFGV